jgi:hypothetical protein
MVKREEIREHVARLLDSEQFVTSRSIAKLLAFCVDAALAGDGETLKETTLGVSCFGRTPGYDTKQDPIVRVTARRLRNKLDLFYENEGANDQLRIVLPKGTYVPRFHYQPNQAAITEPSPKEEAIIPDPLFLADAEPISVRNVPVKMQLPVIAGSSWLRPAIWSFVVFLLMTSGAVILTHTQFYQDMTAEAPQDNPSHVTPLAADGSSSLKSGIPRESSPHSSAVKPDDVVVSVEPRL